MGPCREHVHVLRQGTSLWPVTRFFPGERESDEAGLGCTAEDWRWSSPGGWRCPLAHVAGLRPACGRDARAPRDGARASLADSAPQDNSKAAARRLMDPCREHVHGLRQGTSLWPVTRFVPGERESDEAGLGCTAEDWRWSSPRAWRRPLAHVAGLRPACGRDARAPRDGARASLADPAPQGHSKLSARRSMGPCREQVHGLRQGTSLWPVTRFSPGERESDCASIIRGNPMNLGGPTPA